MPADFRDTVIAVESINNDSINIRLPEGDGYSLDIAQLAAYAGGGDSIDTLKRNIAIFLRLSGVDLSAPDINEIQVKELLESKAFKHFRG